MDPILALVIVLRLIAAALTLAALYDLATNHVPRYLRRRAVDRDLRGRERRMSGRVARRRS